MPGRAQRLHACAPAMSTCSHSAASRCASYHVPPSPCKAAAAPPGPPAVAYILAVNSNIVTSTGGMCVVEGTCTTGVPPAFQSDECQECITKLRASLISATAGGGGGATVGAGTGVGVRALPGLANA